MTKRTLSLVIGIPAVLLILFVVAALANTFAPSATSTGGYGIAPAPEMTAPGFARGEMGYDSIAVSDDYGGTKTMYPMPPEEPSAGQTAAEVDQRIIKTGYLDLVVDDVSESASKITGLASGMGGFVQDSSVSEREDGTHFGSVTVRVPAEQFEDALSKIKEFATLVKTETSQGQDVTEQYTDLQAQLRNAQAQETEYLEILKKAQKVEDILAVQQYLGQIRSQIESLQGRIKYLENVTTYSTISASLSEEPIVRVPTKAFRPGSIASEAVQALIAIGQNLLTALIWLAIVGGGLLIPSALVVWVLVLVVKKILDRWLK
jgi:hypothetical protein